MSPNLLVQLGQVGTLVIGSVGIAVALLNQRRQLNAQMFIEFSGSQMTVSEMSIQNTTPSHQQRQHWLSEQALAWSGLPVVTIRPTMFLESFLQLAAPSVRNRDRIELPFGRGKTSPVAAADVAQVVAA